MSQATSTAKGALQQAWKAGESADSARGAVETAAEENKRLSPNLVGGALTLLVTLIVVLLAALVGGEFASAIPSDSTFSSAINTTTDNAGTAFVIFGVTLLAIPATAAVAYIITNMGPVIGSMGMR